MARCLSLYRTATNLFRTVHTLSTASSATSHHNSHQSTHKFLEPCSFIGSWESPRDPKEAEAKLAQLRRDYAKQVKQIRKEYINEVELLRLEKQRKDDARKETLKVANEERRKLKAEAAKLRAEERKVTEEEFRQTLLKERKEKLDNWRMKENSVAQKKNEKKELLHRQSSMWIDEDELGKKIYEVIVHATPL